jgi:TolA-binding protein
LLPAFLVGANPGRAESETPARPVQDPEQVAQEPAAPADRHDAPDQSQPPAHPAAESAAVAVGQTSEPPAVVDPAQNHPANENPAPVPARPVDRARPEPVERAVSEPAAAVGPPATAPSATEAGASAAPATHAQPFAHLTDPHEEIAGLIVLGASLTERSDFDAAEIAFRQVMASRRATGDDLAHALLGLARVHRKQGALTKAAAIYERYLKDYPADNQVPDALLELGRTHRALGAPQLALSRFYSVINSTLKLSSEQFGHYQMLAKTAQFEIAETHFQQGDYTEANKFFSRLRLLDLAPADRARAHFKSAYALYLGNDLDGAVTTLHSYLEQWPQDENVPEARYLLSLSLRSLGRKQEALDATLELLRSQQATGDAKRWSYWQRRTGNQLANDFFQNGDTQNALAIYQGLANLSPDPGWRLPITYQIGLCYERMRITERAMAAYQSIVDGTKPAARPEPAERAEPVAATEQNIPDGAPGEAAKPAAPKPASPELTELARMAAWRLTQLNWHEQTENQLTTIFATATAPAKPTAPPANATAPNIESNAATPSVNDQAGNPPTTPASL